MASQSLGRVDCADLRRDLSALRNKAAGPPNDVVSRKCVFDQSRDRSIHVLFANLFAASETSAAPHRLEFPFTHSFATEHRAFANQTKISVHRSRCRSRNCGAGYRWLCAAGALAGQETGHSAGTAFGGLRWFYYCATERLPLRPNLLRAANSAGS